MDSISSLASLLNIYPSAAPTPVTVPPKSNPIQGDADGDSDGSKSVNRRSGGFVNTVLQALNQSGITLPSVSASGSTTSNVDPTAQASGIQQALQTFLHSLVQALTQNSSASTTSPQTGQDLDTSHAANALAVHHHGGHKHQIEAEAQKLLQSLSAPNGSDTSSADSALNSSFQNLLQTINSTAGSNSATASAGTPSGQPSLQSFVQHLVQDLGASSTLTMGNFVSTTA